MFEFNGCGRHKQDVGEVNPDAEQAYGTDLYARPAQKERIQHGGCREHEGGRVGHRDDGEGLGTETRTEEEKEMKEIIEENMREMEEHEWNPNENIKDLRKET